MVAKELKWEDIFQSTTLVKLSADAKWGGTTTLTAAALGVPASDVPQVEKAISLGKLRLANPGRYEKINAVKTKAKEMCEAAGIKFPLIRSCFFVSNEKMPGLLDNLATCAREHEEAVEEFIRSYEDIKAEALPELGRALCQVCKTEDAAFEALRRAEGMYPVESELRRKFRLEWDTMELKSSGYGAMSTGKKVAETVQKMIESLREEVAERLGEVISLAMKANNKLNQKTVRSTLELLARVRDLNRMMGDANLARQINGLESLLSSAGDVPAISLVAGFESAKKAMSQDIEAATAAAIDNLTGFGARRIG